MVTIIFDSGRRVDEIFWIRKKKIFNFNADFCADKSVGNFTTRACVDGGDVFYRSISTNVKFPYSRVPYRGRKK